MKVVLITTRTQNEVSVCTSSEFGINSNIECFDAIYPRSMDLDYENLFKLSYVRKPLIGEYGCYLSHTSVWSKYANENAVLVLEDDARYEHSERVDKIIDYCANNKSPMVIKVGASKLKKTNEWLFFLLKPALPIAIVEDRVIGEELFLNTDGTVGYIINHSAMKLLNESNKSCRGMLADDWPRMRSLGVKVLTVRPLIVFEAADLESTIDKQGIRKKIFKINLRSLTKIFIFLPLSASCFFIIVVLKCAQIYLNLIKTDIMR